MAGFVPVSPRFKFTDSSGNPVAGGTLTVYLAGTTTLTNTWQDEDLTILNTNPITLDANGECLLWADSTLKYKLLLKDSGGATVTGYPVDNVPVVGNRLLADLSFTQSGTGAVTRTALEKARDFICILDFIPVAEHAAIRAGTSTYDCTTALANAIASRTVQGLGLQVLTGGAQIYFPAGKYYYASTQHLKTKCHLKGEASGMQGGWSTHFVFPAGTSGFVIHKENTGPSGTVASTTGADGTVLEDILFYGTSRVGFPNAHGVWLRARAALVRCTFQAFGGNGVHILASAGGGGFIEGNANCFYIENCCGLANGGHGLFVDGADANAGTVVMFDASINLGWGIYDSSFLGNTYVGCHTTDNVTGAYKSDSANARNVFLGCYSEGGWPASEILAPAMVIGGLHGAGFTALTTALILDVDAGGAFVKNGLQMPTASVGYGQAATSGVGLTFRDTGGVSFWTMEKAVGRWGWKWANGGTPGFLNFYDQTATVANGYARDLSTVNGAIGLGAYYFGTIAQQKYRGLDTAAPVSGTWLQGDFVWNSAPAAGGTLGWVCTTGGTPGTWKAVTGIAP